MLCGNSDTQLFTRPFVRVVGCRFLAVGKKGLKFPILSILKGIKFLFHFIRGLNVFQNNFM